VPEPDVDKDRHPKTQEDRDGDEPHVPLVVEGEDGESKVDLW
jgi:hypothetical protein